MHVSDYVKLSTDADTAYNQILEFTDTTITLTSNYTGTGGTGTLYSSLVQPSVSNDATISVGSGNCTLASGTTTNNITYIKRTVDVLPLVIESEFSVTQRIANQDIYFGVFDDSSPIKFWASFRINGTDASKIITETAHSRSGSPTATDTESYTKTIPSIGLTSQLLRYRIEIEQSELRFLVNDIVISKHRRVLMKPTSFATMFIKIVNGTSPASSTSVSATYIRAFNYNKVSVGFSDRDDTLFTTDTPSEFASAIPVRITPSKTWRTTFAKTLSGTADPSFWTVIKKATGQTINQSSGNLVITSGTTPNEESIIRSTQTWSDSFILKYNSLMSARSTTNNFVIELVDVIGDGLACTITNATTIVVTIPSNPFTAENIGQGMYVGNISLSTGIPMRGVIASVTSTTITLTVAGWPASGSCTVSLFGWNYQQIIYNTATVTSATYDAQRMGWNTGATTMAINTTNSPGHVGQLYNEDGMSIYSDALAASATAYQFTQRASRLANIPANDVPLYIQIRCLNGTTTATAITWTLGFISMEEFASAAVNIQGSKQIGAGTATAVQITGGSSTVTATNLSCNVAQIAGTNTLATGLAGIMPVGGGTIHGGAITPNPVRIGARAINANYATLTSGQAGDLISTLVGALIEKPYSIPELDWNATDSITNSTTAVQLKAATASNKNYVTSLSIAAGTLASAIEIQVRDTPIASSTATIASNTLVMSGTYNWKVGDLVYVTSSTVTGLTATQYYYLLTVSGTSLTFSTVRGGTTLSISGTSVAATLAHVIYRTQLQTTALPLTNITFTNPISSGTGLALEICTPSAAATGRIDFNVIGYVAP